MDHVCFYTSMISLVTLILYSAKAIVEHCKQLLFVLYGCHSPAITVMFSQTMYSCVNEGAGSAQPVLVLSNPAATDNTVQVTNTDRSATGEYYSILINY